MLLSELGDVSEELRERICSQQDYGILKEWLKMAAKAECVEDFQQKCELICGEEVTLLQH